MTAPGAERVFRGGAPLGPHGEVIDLEEMVSGSSIEGGEGPSAPGGEKGEIVIVGTAHVSEKSVQEVRQAIEDLRPDVVAVELCRGSYRALRGEEETGEIQIKVILRGGKLYLRTGPVFSSLRRRGSRIQLLGENLGTADSRS